VQIDENYFGYWLLINFVNHACIPHIICMCICVAAAVEEIVYEVVAEPQESQGQAPQPEVRGELAQGPADPSAEQQTQGKPRCMSYYLNCGRTGLNYTSLSALST
jgi:hypothetical protein